MAMTKTALESALRLSFLDKFIGLLSDEEVLRVGSNEIAIPCVDAAGNDAWVVVKVSTPRGTRNGEGGYNPYDGYAAADDYALDCEEKAEKRKAADEKKAAKIAADAKRRAEKAVKKAEAEAAKAKKDGE